MQIHNYPILLGQLPWSKQARAFQQRVCFLHELLPEEGWPDFSDLALEKTLEDWFAPFCTNMTKWSQIQHGMADKNLIQLRPGDEITTLHYASSLYGDDDFVQVPVDTFTVTEDTHFAEEDMGDGVFLMMFELEDAKGNTTYSEMVQLVVDGEYVDIEILD